MKYIKFFFAMLNYFVLMLVDMFMCVGGPMCLPQNLWVYAALVAFLPLLIMWNAITLKHFTPDFEGMF